MRQQSIITLPWYKLQQQRLISDHLQKQAPFIYIITNNRFLDNSLKELLYYTHADMLRIIICKCTTIICCCCNAAS